jgi:hypothetical protein
MDNLRQRLLAGLDGLRALRPAIEAGEPWPLSASYGAEPESQWGPKEVLAHVAEMVPYWQAQVEGILAAPGPAAVPFGRVATDDNRIARIGADRQLPVAVLLGRIDAAIEAFVARSAGLTDEERERLGAHARLGEMPVGAIVERFVAGHLDEHVGQLADVLETRT